MVKIMIYNIGKTAFYIGPLLDLSPFSKENKYIPRFFYFDGGCYFKIGFYFVNYIFELSRLKKDNRIYKEVTSEELDEILRDINK